MFGILNFGHCDLPIDLAQGGESFDAAQDREPVERPVEPRISLCYASLVRNDGFKVLRHSLLRGNDKMGFHFCKTIECLNITFVRSGSKFVFGQEWFYSFTIYSRSGYQAVAIISTRPITTLSAYSFSISACISQCLCFIS